jgi:hypothetical protein
MTDQRTRGPDAVADPEVGSAPWNPWRALRARGGGTLFAFAPLGGPDGRWERDAEGDVILVEQSLGRCRRRVALAHELIHAERGIGHPDASPATMVREESIVDREVARRLVPTSTLRRFAVGRASVGGVDLHEIADEFDVTVDVAALACELLGPQPAV